MEKEKKNFDSAKGFISIRVLTTPACDHHLDKLIRDLYQRRSNEYKKTYTASNIFNAAKGLPFSLFYRGI